MVQNVLRADSQSKLSQLWGCRGPNASFEMRLCAFKAERNIKLVLLLVVFGNPAGSAGGRPKSAPQAVRGAKKIFRVNVRQHLQDVFIGEGLACCQHPNVSVRCQKTVVEFAQEGKGTGSRPRRKRSRAQQHSTLRSRVTVIQRSARFAPLVLEPLLICYTHDTHPRRPSHLCAREAEKRRGARQEQSFTSIHQTNAAPRGRGGS